MGDARRDQARALRRDPPDARPAQERERDAAARPRGDQSIAVIGPRADSVVRDWYGGTPPYPCHRRQGIVNKLGPDATVNYVLNDNGGAATAAAAVADVRSCSSATTRPAAKPFPPWGTCPSPYEGREQVDRDPHRPRSVAAGAGAVVAAVNPRTIVVLVSSFPQGIGWIGQRAGDPARHQFQPGAGQRGRRRAVRRLQPGRPHDHHLVSERDRHPDRDHRLRHQEGHDATGTSPARRSTRSGYGLSYATFEYSNPTSARRRCRRGGSVDVGVDVTNTSAVAGDEVVQLYVAIRIRRCSGPAAAARFPARHHRRGGDVHVTFPLRADRFAY